MEELKTGLRQLKSGKSTDSGGIAAEMLKHGGADLHKVLLLMFNDITSRAAPLPDSWKHTVVKVLYKSGDAKLPQNYRPISIIPMLYKLFARLLYNRLLPILDQRQSPDQAGFRPNRSTTDHLFTIAILQETADEWQVPMWAAAVDFKKAFDSVTHRGIWDALQQQGVDQGYIELLRSMYRGQTACVRTDRTSAPLTIQRGTKQGDPLSSLLFNSVSEYVLGRMKQKWGRAKIGIHLHPAHRERLCNLRFADDILFLAPTLQQVSRMIGDLCEEARQVGLTLHPGKTKILHNAHCANNRSRIPDHAHINGMDIEILNCGEHTKYLGRKLCFSDSNRSEIEHRITAAWRKFHSLKQELTGRRYSLKDRIRLFNGAVTPTVLYGSEAWTMTKEVENRVKRTQRQMLRMIIHLPRRRVKATTTSIPQCGTPRTPRSAISEQTDSGRDITSEPSPTQHQEPPGDDCDDDDTELESWVDWIKRCTREAENI